MALARPLEAKRLLDGCESAPDAIATAVNVAAERLPALLHDAGDYDKALNAYLELGDWDGAERIALRPDFPALAPRQRVLDALYAAVPARGAALFAELLSMLPRELNDEQLRFLSANMRTLRSIDSGIAVQAAERMLVSRPASNFVFEAGAYLAVYDRPHYLRMELLFAAWRDRLTKMTVGELVRLYPEEPFPVHAVRAGAFDDRWVELLHLDRHAPKPTVVAFWESWCAPCRREAPVLERIRTRGDVNVLLISEASDGGGMLHREFEATTLPLSLIFDSEARLIKRVTGEFSERDLP